MAYVKAAITMTLGVQTSRSFVDCNHFKMGCFVVAGFVLTSMLHSPSARAELLVKMAAVCYPRYSNFEIFGLRSN